MSCVECEREFLYSDPEAHDLEDGSDSPHYCICKDCIIKIAKTHTWYEKTKS
jgi:hypothetical protein